MTVMPGLIREVNCVLCSSSDLRLVDNLQPFYKEVESLHDNSEALLKMMKKIDAYTKVLESRVDNLF